MSNRKFRFIIFLVLLALLLGSCAPKQNGSNSGNSPSGPAPSGDYGDAPDGQATGYPAAFAQVGHFPTLFASDGARTLDVTQAWLGESVSAEVDANDPADPDGTPNLPNTDSDDGLTDLFISLTAIPAPTTLSVDVGAPADSQGGTYYLNALIDLNMDGEWGGRGANGELEWVVQNQPVQVVPGVETPYTSPPFAFSNGNLLPDGAFMRLALTKEKVPANWDGTGEFSAGEIEDHFIKLPDFAQDGNGKGKTTPPPILSVDCGGSYQPGQMVTCTVTNLRPVAGTFTYALRHLGPGTVGVPIGTCNPPPPGGPLAIAPNGVVAITCNSTPGDTPDNWRFIAKVKDPGAVVVVGGILLGHSDTSISDFGFEGQLKENKVYIMDLRGSHIHYSGYSTVVAIASVYANDPYPIPGATVSLKMVRSDGSSDTQTAVSGPDGNANFTFTIYTYGTYTLEVENIEGENMVYTPELNAVSSIDVVVGPEAGEPLGGQAPAEEVVPSYEVNTFVDKFNTAFETGDVDTLYSLLNPATIDLYGEKACREYLDSVIGNTIQIGVANVVSFGPWDWEIDGKTTSLDNIYTILMNVTVQGNTGQQEIHYGQMEDGSLTWFTDCGDPLP